MHKARTRLFWLLGLALLVQPELVAGGEDVEQVRRTKQYGCERLDFRIGKDPDVQAGFLILPVKKAADESKPWLWFAPTLRDKFPNESHDWLFTRLLDAGFAIGGVDVDESWGNPPGRAGFTRFYRYAVSEQGLSRRACMLAQTRGALMVFNWAAENPKCVQCIGAIYPLLKITLGPFFARQYGMTEEELEKNFKDNNPLDRLEPLAAEKVPILTLHGGEDRLVPPDANSGELERRYKKLGGPIRFIVRRTARHEVSVEFFESDELLHFFLSQVPGAPKTGPKDAGTGDAGAEPATGERPGEPKAK